MLIELLNKFKDDEFHILKKAINFKFCSDCAFYLASLENNYVGESFMLIVLKTEIIKVL